MKSTRQRKRRRAPTKRYSAKLLFQFRVMVDGSPGRRRLCEERIITFHAENARAALRKAKKTGRAAQTQYKNSDGNRIYLEPIGVLELLRLEITCEPDEVRYEIKERISPSERRSNRIPDESRLHAIRNDD